MLTGTSSAFGLSEKELILSEILINAIFLKPGEPCPYRGGGPQGLVPTHGRDQHLPVQVSYRYLNEVNQLLLLILVLALTIRYRYVMGQCHKKSLDFIKYRYQY